VISGIESAVLKLRRASVHINAIKASVLRYSAHNPGQIASQAGGKNTLDFREDPDLEIAILAGEAVYQVKSSLDHLAFELVKFNPGKMKLPDNWEKHCEFPLMLDVPAKGNPSNPLQLPLPYNYFKDRLPGISKQAFKFIETVQPYYRRNTANVLRPIAQLSNIDKHRHLHVLDPQAYHIAQFTSKRWNHLSVRRANRGDRLDCPIPAEWFQEKDAVYLENVGHPFVSFNERVLGKNMASLPN
jgi:hypothetical protein